MEAKYIEIIIPDSLDQESMDKAIEHTKQRVEEIVRGEFEEQRRNKYPIWDDLALVFGTWIGTYSDLKKHVGCTPKSSRDKNVFLTEEHAKRALAEAQISQLMPYYGGEITADEWCDESMIKYVVTRTGGTTYLQVSCLDYQFIAFRTAENRNNFMSREQNVQLVRDYFMLD